MKISALVAVMGIITTILFLNMGKSKTVTTYTFKRNFRVNNVLKYDKNLNNDAKDGLFPITTDDTLVYTLSSDLKAADSSYYHLKAYNQDLKMVQTTLLHIPAYANILFTNQNITLFTKLFSFYVHDNHSQINTKINTPGLKIFKAFTLKDQNTFLCIGELADGEQFKTGLFIINRQLSKITDVVSILESNATSNAPQNQLRYSGRFVLDADTKQVTYYCDKFSKIYSTDHNGHNFRAFTTKDHAPLPQIVTNLRNNFYYKRGATWGTNHALFSSANNYYIFSSRSPVKDSLVIDVYSKHNFDYLSSFSVFYKGKRSADIDYVCFNHKQLTIVFDDSLASFIYSR
jgi:hypothetical protein